MADFPFRRREILKTSVEKKNIIFSVYELFTGAPMQYGGVELKEECRGTQLHTFVSDS